MNPTGQSQMLLVGRTLLGLLFVVSGVRAATSYALSVAYFTHLGFPAPYAMVALVILIEVGGGALLIAGWQTKRVAWLLVAFVAIASGTAHRFWEYEPAYYVNQLQHFLKNVAIIGGLLYVAAIGGGAASIEHRRR